MDSNCLYRILYNWNPSKMFRSLSWSLHCSSFYLIGEYTMSEMLVSMSTATTLEEFYPAAAIATLMRIIRDPSLSQHHTMVVQAITFIFKSLGLKCVPYLSQVMPAYLAVIDNSDSAFREVGKRSFLLNDSYQYSNVNAVEYWGTVLVKNIWYKQGT